MTLSFPFVKLDKYYQAHKITVKIKSNSVYIVPGPLMLTPDFPFQYVTCIILMCLYCPLYYTSSERQTDRHNTVSGPDQAGTQ